MPPPTKYRAEIQAVGHECDLAILVVENEEFWEGMDFLELGDIPFLQEVVSVVAYPQEAFHWNDREPSEPVAAMLTCNNGKRSCWCGFREPISCSSLFLFINLMNFLVIAFCAGLGFVPITRPYLHDYGEEWCNTSPCRVCEQALKELPEKAGQQLIILSQVLMDNINAGYGRLAELQVKKVNGLEIDNLKHRCELVEDCGQES
ncbi:hypothetical protein OIU84_019596 [Salix udensis]|uniref:Protease Do-like PDZ domain-containing protein n=1 Tax=Salix udensis TaxID=889485 RepID=A0AAD6PKH8_9ROSI|nr:hypothetical protein OIU84_019596 [Salix udensis]